MVPFLCALALACWAAALVERVRFNRLTREQRGVGTTPLDALTFLGRRLLPGVLAYALFWTALVTWIASTDTGQDHDRNSLVLAALGIGSLLVLAVVGLLTVKQLSDDQHAS